MEKVSKHSLAILEFRSEKFVEETTYSTLPLQTKYLYFIYSTKKEFN